VDFLDFIKLQRAAVRRNPCGGAICIAQVLHDEAHRVSNGSELPRFASRDATLSELVGRGDSPDFSFSLRISAKKGGLSPSWGRSVRKHLQK
jgi:hypothetical protein